MDHGLEALVGFVAAQGEALELLQLAGEVLDQVAPSVEVAVDGAWRQASRVLGDDHLGAAFIQLSDDPVRVEGRVGDQSLERDVLDERGDPNRVMALARQQHEADQVAQGLGERQDLGGQAALGLADGLAFSPPFAPWPWRWTLTIVPSIMACSMSGASETAAKRRWNTSAFSLSRTA